MYRGASFVAFLYRKQYNFQKTHHRLEKIIIIMLVALYLRLYGVPSYPHFLINNFNGFSYQNKKMYNTMLTG